MNHIHLARNILLAFIFATGVVLSSTSISTADELMDFADKVNSGTTYSWSTVELTEDIDLSGKEFTPIGGYDKNRPNKLFDFRGVFDGKGHLIKNLNLTSDHAYLGLFGYSNGGTFKNIIIDSSCSITNTNPSNISYGAGIVAYANSGSSNTKVINCVNMATITGIGNQTKLGGIAGVLFAYSYSASIQNCANLGTIVHLGTGEYVFAGGIVGWLTGEKGNSTSVSSCVNLGKVTSSPTNTGGIVGFSNEATHKIENNSWAEGTSQKSHSGQAIISNNENLSSESVIEKLSDCFPSSAQQKWVKVSFDTDGGTTVDPMVALNVLIGTPNTPTKAGHTFGGWYMDKNYTQGWKASTEFNTNVTLYAKWIVNSYTLTIMHENEFIQNITEPYGTNASILEIRGTRAKEGHNFSGLFDAEENITYTDIITVSRDAELWEIWTPNKYQVSFVLSDGNKTNQLYTFGDNITECVLSDENGLIFEGWFEDEYFSKQVTFPLKMNSSDMTFYGKWTKQSEYVKFLFGRKDLTQEEAMRIIKAYTDETFEIIKFEGSKETDESFLIVKFVDGNIAGEVYKEIKDNSDGSSLLIGMEFMPQYYAVAFSPSLLNPNIFVAALC